MDLIMNRPGGFDGEVVLAENCHRGSSPWNSLSSGWKPSFSRNSNLDNVHNFNDLSNHLKQKYGQRFTTCHWVNVDSENMGAGLHSWQNAGPSKGSSCMENNRKHKIFFFFRVLVPSQFRDEFFLFDSGLSG
jgi:hypothetical protein